MQLPWSLCKLQQITATNDSFKGYEILDKFEEAGNNNSKSQWDFFCTFKCFQDVMDNVAVNTKIKLYTAVNVST